MSTGNEPGQDRNFFQFSGDNGEGQLRQQSDGYSNFHSEVYDMPRQTSSYRLPTDSHGYPVINNYGGVVNVYVDGGGGGQRGWDGDGGVDWGYEQFRKMKDAQRWDVQTNAWDRNDYPLRPSDMRRQALIDDGRALDDLYRDQFSRASYTRDYHGRMYDRPGQYTSYSSGGRDGLTYYDRGASYYDRNLPWYVNDCFGNGNGRYGDYRYGNGDMNGFRNVMRDVLPFIVAMKHADNNGGGYWDGRYGRGNNGMNYMEMAIMDRALGSRWDRYNPRMFNERTSYAHGGRDGLTYMDQGPDYRNWNGPRSGFDEFASTVMPIFRDVAPFVVAMKHADNDNEYRSRGGDRNYYNERNQSIRMEQNRQLAMERRARQQEMIERNRRDAMERRAWA